ncbi:TetR family transcriptional regulator [Arthrobacter yangruifuii]|uniref:TetR family transcriptional regulator n=1 Tax=Arthrobacter yangruifuii TaxID=2606616 RepID=A0A5N6MRW1_9MICC|nr:TetR/AcrR family transcriptional regulator [Arthrobacter yangruifuii]KAD4059925.1 TetR family transcriptional regulator [Arthrobacter yangruifuii]
MPRWNPDPQERLVTAAVELFRQHGYDAVTVTDIAEKAGLTRRSFFRHFSDKREVLFAGSRGNIPRITRLVEEYAPDVTAREAVMGALAQVGDYLLADPAAQALRQDLIDDSLELQERERTKLADMAAALAAGLVLRGTPPADAHSIGVFSAGIFHSAYVRTLRNEPPGSFADQLHASAAVIARFLTE